MARSRRRGTDPLRIAPTRTLDELIIVARQGDVSALGEMLERSRAYMVSFPEVGARMGRTVGAVTQLWTRAIEKLRDEVEPWT